MYKVVKLFENIKKFIRIKLKIFYFKLKYGNRIKIGKHLIFEKRFNVNINKDGILTIGDYNYFNNDCSINCHNKIDIGDNNLFGENIKIYDHSHIFNTSNYNIKKNYSNGCIKIGNNNWFCSNVVLLQKTNIGSGNVISAGIVFNKVLKDDYIVRNEQKLKEDVIERR